MVARPADSTFLSQSTPSPKGSDMRNSSGVGTAHTGVAFSRPERRPAWWMGNSANFSFWGLSEVQRNKQDRNR